MSATRSLFAAIVIATLAACGQAEPPAPAPRPVIAQVVGTKSADTANIYSGEVRARYENDLALPRRRQDRRALVDVGARGQTRAGPRPPRSPGCAARRRGSARAARAGRDRPCAREAELERHRDLLRAQVHQPVSARREQTTFNAAKARLAQAKAQVATAAEPVLVHHARRRCRRRRHRGDLEPGQVVAAGQPGDALRAPRREGGRDQRSREPARALRDAGSPRQRVGRARPVLPRPHPRDRAGAPIP